jgi:hypothetical protein
MDLFVVRHTLAPNFPISEFGNDRAGRRAEASVLLYFRHE